MPLLASVLDTSSYGGVAAVTPGTTTVEFRALYIGGAGNVAVTMEDGSTATFTAVPVGTVLTIRVKQVLSVGTTATNILGLI